MLLGGAFVLRSILLETLYAPGAGTAKRMLTLLLEGVSLGALDYHAYAAVTGYVAMLTIAAYLVGLWLLASDRPTRAMTVVRHHDGELVLLALIAALSLNACGRPAGEPAKQGESGSGVSDADTERAARLRDEALRSARVWRTPAVPVARANLAGNPPGPGGFETGAEVTCRFLPKAVGGTSPKFNCELPGGDTIRVKYGVANPEGHAEVAATRLLAALGFPADQMFVVKKVRCLGCPQFPLPGAEVPRRYRPRSGVLRRRYRLLARRRLRSGGGRAPASRREDRGLQGPGLGVVRARSHRPGARGIAAGEVDALRLMAMLLAHWDNKAENQRLVCASGNRVEHGCRQALVIVQELGATFGPRKVDLANWQRTRIWSDAGTCTVSMETLPYKGGTFPKHRRLGGRAALHPRPPRAALGSNNWGICCTASRVTSSDQVSAAARSAEPWVAAFRDKVRQIREAGPCGG